MSRTRIVRRLWAAATTVTMAIALLLGPAMTPPALADGAAKPTPPTSSTQKAASTGRTSNPHDPLAGERWLQGMRVGFGQTATQTTPAPGNKAGAATARALGTKAAGGANPMVQALNQARSLPTVPTAGYSAAISRTPGLLQQSSGGTHPSVRSLSVPAGPVPDAPSNQWQSVGPAPITGMDLEGLAPQYNSDASGRISSLAVSQDGKVIYVGAAGGGVWRSVDGGQGWKPLTDDQASLAMGGLAVQWNADWHKNVIYAGTGEFHQSVDSMYGAGILKSTDGGDTWTTLDPWEFFGCAFGAVAVGSDGTVFAGGNCGLFSSTDGGQTWSSLFSGLPFYDLKVVPSSGGYTVYAATPTGLFQYGSGTDPTQASNWTLLSDSPQVGDSLQTKLAFSSAGDIYATVATGSSVTDALYIYQNGAWQTKPLGDIYDETFLDGGPSYNMGWYANALAVDPQNSNHIWVGGVGLMESLDGGATWSTDKAESQGIHVDFHDMAYDGQGNLYLANDGGIWKLGTDGKVTNLNHNLSITQVYPGLSQYDNGARIAAGTQDNGFFLRKNGVSREIAGGDGTVTLIDPTNPNVVWVEYPHGYLQVSTDGGKTFDDTNGDFVDVGGGNTQWLAPLVMDPTNPNVIYQGRDYRVVVSYDGPDTKPGMYNPMDPAHSGSWHELGDLYSQANDYPQALAIAPSDPRVIYAGMADGTLFMTEDAGEHWRDVTPLVHPAIITGLAISPTDPYTVYVAGNNKGYSDPDWEVNYGFWASPRVYKTTTARDLNPTWDDLTGDLPYAAVNTVALAGSAVVVGTDVGIFTLDEASGHWYGLGSGLPNAQVLDLKVSPEGTIFAATHGRGVWALHSGAPAASPAITQVKAGAPAHDGTVSLNIYGTNFVGVTSVTVDGNYVLSYQVISPTEIQARTRGVSTGSGWVLVQVEAAGGTSALTAHAYYRYGDPGPTVRGPLLDVGGGPIPAAYVYSSGTVTLQVAGLPVNDGSIQVHCLSGQFQPDACGTAQLQNLQLDLHQNDDGTYAGSITFDFNADRPDFYSLIVYGDDWVVDQMFTLFNWLPLITGVSPSDAAPQTVTVTGLGFGPDGELRDPADPASPLAVHEVRVLQHGQDTTLDAASVTSWSDTSLEVTLPVDQLTCGTAQLQVVRQVLDGTSIPSLPFPIHITSGSDGCGTATVSPGTLTAGQAGQMLTFTYTAPEDITHGAVAIALPSSLWATPDTVSTGLYAWADQGTVTVAPIASGLDPAAVAPYGASTGIFVEDVTLAAGQQLTITYGGPDLVVPIVVGPHPFRVYQARGPIGGDAANGWRESPLFSTPVVHVVPNQPAYFDLSAADSTVTVGDAIYLDVAAKDALGNTVTTYTGTVHFTSTDSRAELPADYQFKPGDFGRKTFVLGLNTVGNERMINVRDTVDAGITGASQPFTVNRGPLSTLVVTGPTTATAGSTFNVTVSAQDGHGNVISDYGGTLHFGANDSAAILPADYTFQNADQGIHSFSVTLRTAGSRTLTVSDALASLQTTTTIAVSNPSTDGGGGGGAPQPTPAPGTTTTTETTPTGTQHVTVSSSGSTASTTASSDQALTISAGGGAVALQMDPGTIPGTGGSQGTGAPQFSVSLNVVPVQNLPGLGTSGSTGSSSGGSTGSAPATLPSDMQPQAAVEITVFLVQGSTSGSGSGNTGSGTDVHQLAKPVTISFTIPPQQLAGAQQVVVAYYNTALGVWIQLPATVDPVTGKVTTTVDHFTQFAVFTISANASKLTGLPSGDAKSDTVSVHGQSAAGTKITVFNNGAVAASHTMTGKGAWSLPVRLVDGRNSLMVVVTENGGTIGLGESVVTYKAPVAPPAPSPTVDLDAVAVDTSAGPATVTSKDKSASFTFAAGSLPAGATAKLAQDATAPVPVPQSSVLASPVWTINTSTKVEQPVTATLHFQLPLGASADQVGLYHLTFGHWEFYGGASKVDTAASTVTAKLPYLGTWALLVNTRSFADLTPTFWGYRSIMTLSAAGITGGLPDGSFQPDRATTKAEFLRMLLGAMGVAPQAAEKSPFADVAADAWYAGYLNAAYEKGLFWGADGLAKPDQAITRQEAATILARAISVARLPGGGAVPVDLGSTYSDRDAIASWALEATTTVRLYGLMRGYPDGSFGPNRALTRAEAAAIMVQFLQQMQTPSTHQRQ